MDNILEKMKKARERRVPIGDWHLIIRRPTDLEATEMRFSSNRDAMIGMAKFVIGWEGVREMDVVPGGSDKPIEFDRDIFSLWIEDQPELWGDLISSILKAYDDHVKKRDEQKKS